ncbi:S8 family peptidase [Mediterraneibacter sp. NSJ-55]|uniref:S8 family peptidase n=1 Tax=Mediterraneibacter hominis TaxID=2763054 RepID=A0A923LI80_9FIRM|nr:S8 family peptidase [Mediterraneibacter hominis]MBC5688744.1 S8 family peptidase [Mediterraneibacter hominis]
MSQKSENLLNLALEATEEERMKSLELEVGYHPIEKEWDLIVKYSGSLSEIRKTAVSVTELMNGYAVLTIEEKQIENLARFPEIEFIEKPKRLFFEAENGRRVSCIDSVQRPPLSLSGRGVLVGIIDSGIDYTNPNFCNTDGTTRIRALWDQSIQGKPPAGYALGTEYTQEQINMALAQEGSIESKKEIVPSRDTSGHGTAVAGVAAGNGRGSEGMRYRGVAYESELIVVKLGNARTDGFPRTTELMQAVDYVIRKALEYRMPVAVNISFGNTYGSHDGTTLLERFIDAASDVWKNVICVGSGNEGNSAGHTWGRINEEEEAEVQLGVQMNEPALNLQIWKSYVDEIEISVVSPSGVHAGPFKETLGAQRFVIGGTELLVYYGEPKPFSVRQEIFIDFLPRETYIESGVWKILLEPRKITEGIYQMWLPSENVLNRGTAFLKPSAEMTLTIPSTASRVVTVAAYDALTFSYADFSGRGLTAYNTGEMQKPDLAAPGVDVTAPSGTGYGKFSGTSFAVPFASGSAALMMEWGIVKENDPYLYGEKVKAYLRRGARKLPGYDRWPNPQLGYGTLCLEESIPRQ